MTEHNPGPAGQQKAPQRRRGDRTLPATPAAVESALEEILQDIERARLPCGDVDEIRLALREALNNALRHGSKMDPGKAIQVSWRCDAADGLWVRIRDEGKGFDPERVPDPTSPENLERLGGRGVYLIRNLMEEVEYRDGGRELHMRRRPRSPEP